MKRVVITGCGTINPLGSDVEETWKSMVEGKDGISELDIPNIERLSVKRGGQVKIKPILGKLPRNFYTNVDRATLLSLIASAEAVNSSGINFEQPLNELSAVVLGIIFTVSALKFGPVLNISFFGIILGSGFYLSLKLYLEDKILFDPTFSAFSTFIILCFLKTAKCNDIIGWSTQR